MSRKKKSSQCPEKIKVTAQHKLKTLKRELDKTKDEKQIALLEERLKYWEQRA
jgi:hypothetical protein